VTTRLTILVAGVLAGACTSSRAPLGADALRTRMDQLAMEGDSTRLAALARDQCRRWSGEDLQKCYEDYFVTLAGNGRVRLALGALNALAGKERSIEAEGHGYTHVIGITAWRPGDDVAAVFAGCTGLFQSGCYHGVIQAYLTREGGVDSANVAGLCDLLQGSPPSHWLRFQCTHGIGHGLEMINAWDLPRSLAGCDWLVSGWDREGCYGGAFMENAVASMPGGRHHTSARVIAENAATGEHTGQGEHGEHGGHDGATPDPSKITFKMRDSTDALYPCSVVGSRYQATCYLLQGGIILQGVKYDFAAAAAACDRAPADIRQNCYLSLGTSASGMTVQNTRKVIAQCSNGDPAFQPWCFVGAVKNYVDVTANPADGIAFCRQVPSGRNQRQCYVALGEEISALHYVDRPARDRACAMVPADGIEACRYGAGLLPVAPPGLPIRPEDP
jgi:hypothetical protein